MKMIKKLSLLCVLAILLVGLSSCQLAKPVKENTKDRLLGLFISYEYLDLFDFEAYLTDSINKNGFSENMTVDEADSKKYQNRLYAELVERETTQPDTGKVHVERDYIFPGVEGISYFMITLKEDEEYYDKTVFGDGISESKLNIKHGDDEKGFSLEGTIYVKYGAQQKTMYFNPVYQDAMGNVYAVEGNEFSFGGENDAGGMYSHKLEDMVTTTIDGKTLSEKASIKINVDVKHETEKIVLYQMNKDNEIIEKSEYKPSEIPNEIKPLPNTEYILLEDNKAFDGKTAAVERKLYDRSTQYLESFTLGANNILTKTETLITWQAV